MQSHWLEKSLKNKGNGVRLLGDCFREYVLFRVDAWEIVARGPVVLALGLAVDPVADDHVATSHGGTPQSDAVVPTQGGGQIKFHGVVHAGVVGYLILNYVFRILVDCLKS